ncbi:hypothetical protein [Campylobacter canadensis]|uniref:beta-lactamase n=1 Tax=Campylobacter canadensis TaxID=449520 RepID=A0ABS7WQH5_9BACT|nr:hypothetical protein [Campylobacter canadensis]MBZ7987010.1 sel1 repeat family protein [Campylobacter canadensis]MBZ7998046.1 sel1 repeat family protein [Campylobacter canadensis]
MKKLLTLYVLALTSSAVGIYDVEPTLNEEQIKLYDECIKENNAKSCENYLDTRNYDKDGYLSLKESLEVAFKGCDELKNAYSCHMVANYYDEGYPPNKFIQDNKEKSYEYKLKACEIDKDFCWFVGMHYSHKYTKTKDKKDKKQALKYYKIACDNGYEYSCEKYKRIK